MDEWKQKIHFLKNIHTHTHTYKYIYTHVCIDIYMGFPGGPMIKNLLATAGDVGSIPRSGRSPRGGNGNPLQYSCLEDSMQGGAWSTVLGVAESDMTEQLSMHAHIYTHTMEYVLAMRSKKSCHLWQPGWMDLECIMQNKRGQKKAETVWHHHLSVEY